MYCHECGKKLMTGMKCCVYCGATLMEMEEVSSVSVDAASVKTTESRTKVESKKKARTAPKTGKTVQKETESVVNINPRGVGFTVVGNEFWMDPDRERVEDEKELEIVCIYQENGKWRTAKYVEPIGGMCLINTNIYAINGKVGFFAYFEGDIKYETYFISCRRTGDEIEVEKESLEFCRLVAGNGGPNGFIKDDKLYVAANQEWGYYDPKTQEDTCYNIAMPECSVPDLEAYYLGLSRSGLLNKPEAAFYHNGYVYMSINGCNLLWRFQLEAPFFYYKNQEHIDNQVEVSEGNYRERKSLWIERDQLLMKYREYLYGLGSGYLLELNLDTMEKKSYGRFSGQPIGYLSEPQILCRGRSGGSNVSRYYIWDMESKKLNPVNPDFFMDDENEEVSVYRTAYIGTIVVLYYKRHDRNESCFSVISREKIGAEGVRLTDYEIK